MPDINTLVGELHAEFDKLETGVATRLHGLLDQLLGHVPAVEAEVQADAAPVVAEAKTYAVHLAGEVATDATAALTAEVKP